MALGQLHGQPSWPHGIIARNGLNNHGGEAGCCQWERTSLTRLVLREPAKRLPTEAQLKSTCRAVETWAAAIHREVSRLLPLARSAGKGYPSSSSGSGSGSTSGGSVSDPTGNSAFRRDPDEAIARTLVEFELLAAATIEKAARLFGRLPLEDEQEVAPTPSGEGYCKACGKYCAGGPDRLRSLYCQACHSAWIRAGSPFEKDKWVEQVRRPYLAQKAEREAARARRAGRDRRRLADMSPRT